jgi:hypothetical protein
VAVIRRLGLWLITVAICLDQLGQVLIRGPKFVLFDGARPSADETISDWVGQCADAGLPLARLTQKLIDAVLGSGHCQRAIGDDDRD